MICSARFANFEFDDVSRLHPRLPARFEPATCDAELHVESYADSTNRFAPASVEFEQSPQQIETMAAGASVRQEASLIDTLQIPHSQPIIAGNESELTCCHVGRSTESAASAASFTGNSRLEPQATEPFAEQPLEQRPEKTLEGPGSDSPSFRSVNVQFEKEKSSRRTDANLTSSSTHTTNHCGPDAAATNRESPPLESNSNVPPSASKRPVIAHAPETRRSSTLRPRVITLISEHEPPKPALSDPAPASVHVTIGRIDVRAVQSSLPRNNQRPERSSVTSLDQYLRERARRTGT
jgi:hypothetical protein